MKPGVFQSCSFTLSIDYKDKIQSLPKVLRYARHAENRARRAALITARPPHQAFSSIVSNLEQWNDVARYLNPMTWGVCNRIVPLYVVFLILFQPLTGYFLASKNSSLATTVFALSISCLFLWLMIRQILGFWNLRRHRSDIEKILGSVDAQTKDDQPISLQVHVCNAAASSCNQHSTKHFSALFKGDKQVTWRRSW